MPFSDQRRRVRARSSKEESESGKESQSSKEKGC